MLGLGNSITSGSVVSEFSPINISTLVGWWDFTDTRFIYSDDGSTAIADDTAIYRIDNKAYVLQNSNANALGAHLRQIGADARPTWKGDGFARFDGTDDSIFSDINNGPVSTGKTSDTTLNGIAMTIFYVADANATSVGSDQYLLNISAADPADRMSVYIDDNSSTDRWQWHIQNNSARTNTVMNCGQNLADAKELWTVHLDSASASSFYRDGDTSDGVSNGSSDDHDIDLSDNDIHCQMYLGRKPGEAGTFFSGDIYEVIIYDKVLTSDELTTVETYLKNKHSIS
tara:strand:+ start:670 stop:1527 length:858 start_codon:yes stop_codon:yes gene_type:complete